MTRRPMVLVLKDRLSSARHSAQRTVDTQLIELY